MKDKYWEAQVPDQSGDKWWLGIFSPTWFDPNGFMRDCDPNPKNVMIHITEDEMIEAKQWLKENKILLCNWEEGGTEDEIIIRYVFRFKTIEDAVAFKLRWI